MVYHTQTRVNEVDNAVVSPTQTKCATQDKGKVVVRRSRIKGRFGDITKMPLDIIDAVCTFVILPLAYCITYPLYVVY